MLGIGGRFTKKDWPSSIVHVFPSAGDGLSVRLHGELLEVCRESVKVLVKSAKLQLVYPL